jgi:prepilin-type N-terminal cleavage/methylation domain-containing protein
MHDNHGFTLVELLVVIAILGAFVALILPHVAPMADEANAAVRDKEMADIQAAFTRFHDHCLPDDATDLADVRTHGLWPLFQQGLPESGADRWTYDPNKQVGWRGPYAAQEGVERINTASAGQEPIPSGGTRVPVVRDPHGGYYRVMAPRNGAVYDYDRLVLVCTGEDQTLNTTQTTNGDDIEPDAGSDDTVVRLLPLAP